MLRPKIAIDIDDTIAESTEAYRKRVNDKFGINLQPEHYRKNYGGAYWNYYEQVWLEHGVRDLIDVDGLHHEMNFDQSHIPLLPGAEFAISQLKKKYDIVLVTARDPVWEVATRAWLTSQFGDDTPELYFSESHRRDGAKTKGQICKEIGASWLIDDNVQHCQSAQDEGIGAILFGRYGWHYEIPDSIINCQDWQSVLEYFEHEQIAKA